MRRLVAGCWLLTVGCWLLLVSCGQRTGDGVAGKAVAEETADSAEVLMERVDHYYKNVIHDSLAQLAPVAMDYFSRHDLWQQYYTTWCLLVNDLVWNGRMEEGFREARKMHHDAIGRHNSFGLSEAYTAMGIAYHFQNNDKQAFYCYQQALKHYPADADQSVKLNIYSYYCQVLIDAREFDEMERVLAEWGGFLNCMASDKDDDSEGMAHKYFRFHRESYKLCYAQKKYKQASEELDQMQHFLDQENDRELYEAQVAGFRTQLAMAQRDYNAAMTWSDIEIDLSRQQDFNTFLNALRHRTEVLQTLGRYEEALIAYRTYDRQKDSIIKADSRQQLNELNKRFEVDELKAQQERTQLEHDREQLQLVLAMAVMVVAGLLFFIVWRHRASKRLRRAHRLLEQSNAELQQSYTQLKVANARAEESSKMKTNFIQQISHEIRTPLNILSGFTQIVTTPGMELDDEERADINRQITENTNRITGLVNRMLELSEANSQAVILCNDEVPVSLIAVRAIEDSGIERALHIQFSLEMGPEADATQMKTNQRQAARALVQLLDNARKFTKQGTVRLLVSIGQADVCFTVEDTGIGVPVYEAERIFGEFVQLDEYYDGTGIGLAVARSIARRMGGDIVLDTSYQQGARFVMTLPR